MDIFSPFQFVAVSLGKILFLYVIFCIIFCAALKFVFEFKLTSFSDIFIYYVGFGLPVCLIGYVTGYLSGLSRASVLGTVLPSVLALLGGVNIYVFGSESKYKLVVGYCVSVLLIALFIGVEVGAGNREFCRESRLRRASQEEFRIRAFRNALGLPPDIAPWMRDGSGDNK